MRVIVQTTLCALLLFGGQTALAEISNWFRRAPRAAEGPVNLIWIFNSEFRGEVATRAALAEAFPRATIEFHDLPPEVLGKDALFDRQDSVKKFLSQNKIKTFADLVISSRADPKEVQFLVELKRQSRGKISLVNFDDPLRNRNDFDLIVTPRFMNPAPGENVMRPLALPSRATPERLANAREEWRDTFEHLPHPIIAVLIGGQTPEMVFSRVNAKDYASHVTELVKNHRGSMIATNSRRTSELATQAFLSTVTGVPFYFHDVKSKEETANPYFAMLAYADYIYVTGDSHSMLSDAVATGKPVYVFAPPTTVEARHMRLIGDLYHSGYVYPPGSTLQPLELEPLNIASEIGDRVRSLRDCEPLLRP